MRILVSMIFLLSLTVSTVAKASESAQNEYITIPILYMTDRAESKRGFSGQRKLENGTSIYNLNTGSLDCSIKNSLKKSLTENDKTIGWRESNKRETFNVNPIEGCGSSNAYKKFGQAITEAALKSEKKEVFVIIHGFNTSFKEATESGAELAYNLECPVVVFDWPSKGKAAQYAVDACNNEWSQEHFDRFLDELKTVKDKSGITFNLLAHSMGNRLAIRSAPILKGQHIFKDIFLVDPDFDAETFVHYLLRYARNTEEINAGKTDTEKPAPSKVEILFSHRDHALPLAELLFGGYTRVGQAADKMLSTIFEPLAPDETNKMTSENTKLDSELRPDWLMKFEWIDFTVLDRGIIGHTIPYTLISNLWSTSQAGKGLQLVESENRSPNDLSKIFLDAFHEKQHISSQLGACKRVVIVKDDSKALTHKGQTKQKL